MGKDQEQREASIAMSTPGKGGGGPGRGGGCPLDRLASKVARREGLAGEEVRETETNRGESGGSLGVKSKSVALSCTPVKVSLKQILRGRFRNWRWGRGHRPKSGARNLELVAKAGERQGWWWGGVGWWWCVCPGWAPGCSKKEQPESRGPN